MTVAPDRLVDLEELRRLAEQVATPGPWRLHWTGRQVLADDPVGPVRVGHRFHDGDAAYIAAANPATILSLLDELDEQRQWRVTIAKHADRSERRVASLEAGLRAIEEVAQFGSSTLAVMVAEQARSLLQSSAASQGDEE